jgi:hypothetical protein
MKKLPIGIQTFSKIIKGNYTYVDKTEDALNLIENYKLFFHNCEYLGHLEYKKDCFVVALLAMTCSLTYSVIARA